MQVSTVKGVARNSDHMDENEVRHALGILELAVIYNGNSRVFRNETFVCLRMNRNRKSKIQTKIGDLSAYFELAQIKGRG